MRELLLEAHRGHPRVLLKARLDLLLVQIKQGRAGVDLKELLDVVGRHVRRGVCRYLVDREDRRVAQQDQGEKGCQAKGKDARYDTHDDLHRLGTLVPLAALLARNGARGATGGRRPCRRHAAGRGRFLVAEKRRHGASSRRLRGRAGRRASRLPGRATRTRSGRATPCGRTRRRGALGRRGVALVSRGGVSRAPLPGGGPHAGCCHRTYAPNPRSLTSHCRSMPKLRSTLSCAWPMRPTTSAAVALPLFTMKLACSLEIWAPPRS